MPSPAVAYLTAHHRIPDIPAKDRVQRLGMDWKGAGAGEGDIM